MIVPFDIAFEGDPAITNEHFDLLRHERQPLHDCGNRVARDFGIGPLVEVRQAHFDVIGDAEDASHPLCRRLRLEFVAIAAREPGERDNPALHCYGNVRRIEVRIPSQLILDVSFDIAI